MKSVKIDIQAAAFPDQFVSDAEKKTEEYGLQIGQAIQYEWFRKDGGNCRFYSQWREFDNGVMRAYVIKSRNGRPRFSVHMGVDYGTLRMTEIDGGFDAD